MYDCILSFYNLIKGLYSIEYGLLFTNIRSILHLFLLRSTQLLNASKVAKCFSFHILIRCFKSPHLEGLCYYSEHSFCASVKMLSKLASKISIASFNRCFSTL